MSEDFQKKRETELSNILAAATLFSQLSGIQIRFMPLHQKAGEEADSLLPCPFCTLSDEKTDCISRLSAISTQMLTSLKSSLHVCRLGLCRIIVPVASGTQLIGSIVSEPILCTREKEPLLRIAEAAETDKTERNIIYIEPAMLYKAAKLLRLSLGCSVYGPEEEPEKTKRRLAGLMEESNLLAARPLLEMVVEVLTDISGTDFSLCKNTCLAFLFCLEELLKDGAVLAGREEAESIFSHWLQADTLGKLKACINMANEQFIAAAFCPLSQKHAALVHKAVSFIHKNYKGKITQGQVASLVYLSPSYFSRVFKETLGCSFNEYVNQVRIEKAKKLLLRPDVDINLVAEMVGYENRSYFGKMFKAQTGTTPKKYRQDFAG